ncbi:MULTISPECIES: response regulator [Cellvibrio]|jgi:two-component system chemotaxis response regulator CheY|uniref:Two-component system chemotaxis response regulator CheY n=1 Tax=Cellvibrio fibrivorans TaxID=126350 RepID=A0ABU1UVY1_9GAMM|nr:response regulator [Cellvibrio fibrivorans]MDR7089367.1 two-component system chemotaxis response regulator CheY [Cellvibrio fibrivorans]
MFTKQELQVIGKTLAQKRDWITKNLNNAEIEKAKAQLMQDLPLIESTLQKVSDKLRSYDEPITERINHYISAKAVSPIRQAAFGRRQELLPGQIRVLVVDDDQLICELINAFLRASGMYQIDFANDGLKAIGAMYDANPIYDLVLCDWNMPTKSGMDVHTAMRAAERYLGTVFMLVTAVTEAKQIRAAIEDGVDDYVVKPLEQDKLIKKIARFFPQVKLPDAD